MVRKTLIHQSPNPPDAATVTTLPMSSAFAAEIEFQRLHAGVTRKLFVERFSDEAERCEGVFDEYDARDRQDARKGASKDDFRNAALARAVCRLGLSNYTGGIARFNFGFDERFETWEEHALDRCADLVKARQTLGLEPGPLRELSPAPQSRVHPPVIARKATPKERAKAAEIAVAAFEEMIAAEETALADYRAILETMKAIASGAAVLSTWASALEKIDRERSCSDCGHYEIHADEQMVEAMHKMSGHLVFVSGEDPCEDIADLRPLRLRWAQQLIEEYGAGNEVAAKIVSRKTA